MVLQQFVWSAHTVIGVKVDARFPCGLQTLPKLFEAPCRGTELSPSDPGLSPPLLHGFILAVEATLWQIDSDRSCSEQAPPTTPQDTQNATQ